MGHNGFVREELRNIIMKKRLIFILSAVIIQSQAAIQWACTSPDIPASYLPSTCTSAANASSSTSSSVVPNASTLALSAAFTGCISATNRATVSCLNGISSQFNTNGVSVNFYFAIAQGNNYYPSINMSNSTSLRAVSDPLVNPFLTSFSNHSSLPSDAIICFDDSMTATSGAVPICPSGTYRTTTDSSGNPDQLLLVQ